MCNHYLQKITLRIIVRNAVTHINFLVVIIPLGMMSYRLFSERTQMIIKPWLRQVPTFTSMTLKVRSTWLTTSTFSIRTIRCTINIFVGRRLEGLFRRFHGVACVLFCMRMTTEVTYTGTPTFRNGGKMAHV